MEDFEKLVVGRNRVKSKPDPAPKKSVVTPGKGVKITLTIDDVQESSQPLKRLGAIGKPLILKDTAE